MPYPNEHAARVADESDCGRFKRMNQGSGVSLILCEKNGKMEAVSYRFAKDKFTPDEAKAWLAKHDLRADKFEPASDEKVEAKLSMRAANGRPEVDGRIWSSGMHHVYVNDQPARVYVPEETIMQTFGSIRNLIEDQGRMPIGIDHLSDSVLEENDILRKLNLLDVGDVTKVGTDGSSIYILDSELKNQQIRELNAVNGLPAYSIVGTMDAKPCPHNEADYVVNSIDVERVDFVQEGGCSVCKVGAQPGELILTSKKVKEGEDIMVDEAKVQEPVDDVKVDEPVLEEKAEEEEVKVEDEPVVEEVKEEEVVEVEEEVDEVAGLKDEIAELRKELKELGGKKPKLTASDAEAAVKELIKAGKALPKMKEGLIATYNADPEAFATLAASMPKMVTMETKAKLAKVKKEERENKAKAEEDAAAKDMAKRFFKVDL